MRKALIFAAVLCSLIYRATAAEDMVEFSIKRGRVAKNNLYSEVLTLDYQASSNFTLGTARLRKLLTPPSPVIVTGVCGTPDSIGNNDPGTYQESPGGTVSLSTTNVATSTTDVPTVAV